MIKTSLRLALALFLLTLVLWVGGLVPWGSPNSAVEHPFNIPLKPLIDRVVVVGKMKDEDTNWVIDELPE